MAGRVQTGPIERRRPPSLDRTDLRWLAAWVGVFFAGILAMLAVHWVYRVTGPHPHVTQAIRTLKHHSRWLIPGLKGRRSEVAPAASPRYAGSSPASGQAAQRANA